MVAPGVEIDVIDEMPAMPENCFSSTEATVEAIDSGLAPGNDAETEIVGKSTRGTAATGNCL